jgi:Tfp pilus assembly protein PilV
MKRIWHQVRGAATGEEGFGLVETLIALTILVVGLLAVSGLTMASARQARIADWRGDMTAAGLLALEEVRMEDFTTLASRSDTFAIGGRDYPVYSGRDRFRCPTAREAGRRDE